MLLSPVYSPELKPVENFWHYPHSHHRSNRSSADSGVLPTAGANAYRALTPETMWLKRAPPRLYPPLARWWTRDAYPGGSGGERCSQFLTR